MSYEQEQLGGASLDFGVERAWRTKETIGEHPPIRSIDDLIIFVDTTTGMQSKEMESFKEFAAMMAVSAHQAQNALRQKNVSDITPEDVIAASFAKKSYHDSLQYIGEERLYDADSEALYRFSLQSNDTSEETLVIESCRDRLTDSYVMRKLALTESWYINKTPYARRALMKEYRDSCDDHEYDTVAVAGVCSIGMDAVSESVEQYVRTNPEWRKRLAGSMGVNADTNEAHELLYTSAPERASAYNMQSGFYEGTQYIHIDTDAVRALQSTLPSRRRSEVPRLKVEEDAEPRTITGQLRKLGKKALTNLVSVSRSA